MRETIVAPVVMHARAKCCTYFKRVEGMNICICAFFIWGGGGGKTKKKLSAKVINKELIPVYADNCLSCKVVHNSVNQFS